MNARMRWAGFFGLLGLASIAGIPFLWAGETVLTQLPIAQEASPKPTSTPSNTEGFPLEIPCHIHSICAGERETQFGKILKITPEWVVLDPQHERLPIVAKHPAIGRLFKNTLETLPTGEGEVWIPRSTIHKIVVHRPQTQSFISLNKQSQRRLSALGQASPQSKGEIESVSFNSPVPQWVRILNELLTKSPEVSPAEGVSMPSAYYLRDDVGYFPHGPVFKLSRPVEAIEEHRLQQQKSARLQK